MSDKSIFNLKLDFFPEKLHNIDFLETIFSLSNGKFGVRMTSPVSDSNGTLINGFFESRKIIYGETAFGYAKRSQTIVNLPNLRRIEISDLEGLIFNRSKLIDVNLDMKTGILNELYLLENSKNETIKLNVKSVINEYKTNYYAIKYDLEPESYSGKVKITKLNNMDKEYARDINMDPRKSNFTNKIRVKEILKKDNFYSCNIQTSNSNKFVTYAFFCDNAKVLNKQFIDLSLIKSDNSIIYYNYISNINENVNDYSFLNEINFKKIISDNRIYWERVWNNSLLEFDNAQKNLNIAMIYNIFQLYQSGSRQNQLSIPAKGLSGDGYEGHYFWDTEMYLLPFFALNDYKIARNILKYRYNILNEAKRRAYTLGISKGALFTWRTINGQEASAYFPAGTAQYHIDADIAYAVDFYYKCTEDINFIVKYGFELLLETARFWREYGTIDKESNTFKFLTVTGPDEYTALVDNDYYTNVMAKYNLKIVKRYALELERLGYDITNYGTNWKEIEYFNYLSDIVYLPYNNKLKISAQDDSFLSKPKWPFKDIPQKNYPLLLHYHPLTIYRYQVAKQPDV
ncbi:glycoside hydrolase family 65 protein, partial [Bombilactobacillus bombi]|uniref:glycoside hydrolase family 65 protein n=1 Tax=Bombilactobacillus bombi TaxID=1303590 RepID=UPI0015E59FDD